MKGHSFKIKGRGGRKIPSKDLFNLKGPLQQSYRRQRFTDEIVKSPNTKDMRRRENGERTHPSLRFQYAELLREEGQIEISSVGVHRFRQKPFPYIQNEGSLPLGPIC